MKCMALLHIVLIERPLIFHLFSHVYQDLLVRRDPIGHLNALFELSNRFKGRSPNRESGPC